MCCRLPRLSWYFAFLWDVWRLLHPNTGSPCLQMRRGKTNNSQALRKMRRTATSQAFQRLKKISQCRHHRPLQTMGMSLNTQWTPRKGQNTSDKKTQYAYPQQQQHTAKKQKMMDLKTTTTNSNNNKNALQAPPSPRPHPRQRRLHQFSLARCTRGGTDGPAVSASTCVGLASSAWRLGWQRCVCLSATEGWEIVTSPV